MGCAAPSLVDLWGLAVKRKDVQRLAAELVDGIEQLRHDLALRDAQVQQLTAEVSMLRAAMGALDAFHRPIHDDDIDSLTSGDRFCAADDEAWPCSTHRLLHPAEANQ